LSEPTRPVPFIPILHGIEFAEFQHRQPEWREAIGSAASIRIPAAGIGAILPQIVAGLKRLDLQSVDGHEPLRAEAAGVTDAPAAVSSAQAVRVDEVSVAKRRSLWKIVVSSVVVVLALIAGGLSYRSHRAKRLTDKDTIVLADFTNTTGDPVFDDTLKTALGISLDQSPFLNVLPDSKVTSTLKLMARPLDTKLTPDIARDLCQRASSKAYIAGSIASLGSQYVLGLKVVNCQSGDTLAQEQATAAAKEKVLDALGGVASKLRGELGESLATVDKLDVPLPEETTSSLEALKEYSLGVKISYESKTAPLLHDQRAIELDPNFAAAYASLAVDYWNLGESEQARLYFTKAFQLREHASEREKLAITGQYYGFVTGQLDKALVAHKEYVETYPRRAAAYGNLGNLYGMLGEYEKAAEVTRQAMLLEPDDVVTYGNLAYWNLALQRFDAARQTIQQAQARKLDTENFHDALYALGFLGSDPSLMAGQQKWYEGQPDLDDAWLTLESQTEAYGGRLGKARDLSKRYVESAIHVSLQEDGAGEYELAAVREAAFGNATEAKRAAEKGLKLSPASRGVQVEAALAYAMMGDTARAESIAQDLNRRFPLDTQMQSLWLPTIQGQMALVRRNPAAVLAALQTATHLEFGNDSVSDSQSCLFPAYIRGEAYLAAGQGKEAAGEFQKILDHSGIVWNCWTGALARLGVARGNALQARTSQGADADAARIRALAAYKDFLTLWKDADPDVPILKQAKAEYAKLQ